MLAALIIVFREVVEAGLIVGIVAAVTRGLPGSRTWICGGILAGVLGSCIVALFTSAIADAFSGFGQELLNAAILATAVIMLAWHNIWMARHGRELAQQVRAVGRDVAAGARSHAALAVVVGLAVLREGSEVVLFLYGLFVSGHEAPAMFAAGGVAGLCLGGALSYLTYRGLVKIPPRYIFSVIGWLITFLAAGMAAQSVGFLESAGVVTALDQTAYDTSAYLSETSILGRILHTLLGYQEQPTVMQVAAYLATLVVIAGLGYLGRSSAAHTPKPSSLSV